MPLSRLAIGVVGYRRPDLLWRTLQNLAAARPPNSLKIAFLDRHPDSSVDPTCHRLLDDGPVKFDHIVVPDTKLGCNGSIRQLMEVCFDRADAMCLIEDDVCITHDYFTYILPALERYKHDGRVLCVSTYNRRRFHDHEDFRAHQYHVEHSSHYCCWGMGWWKDRFTHCLQVWPEGHDPSWDVAIQRDQLRRRQQGDPRFQSTVVPAVSRVQNLGFYEGAYSPSYAHWQDQVRLDWHADLLMPRRSDWRWPLITALADDGRPQGWCGDGEASLYLDAVSATRGGVVIEVGVWLGRSLSYVAPTCRANGNRLFAVDHWRGSPEHEEIVHAVNIHQAFEENLKALGLWDTVTVISKPSTEAAKEFPDDTLDVVFIDANHSYESVKTDIESWWPKLRVGGTMLGHDYRGSWVEVTQAVDSILGKPEAVRGHVWKVTKQ